MFKMLVSDMDGTLLKKDHSISERNKMAIRKLRDMGIHFIIATGRPDQLVKEYVSELELDDEIIMCNGAVIGHPMKKERLLDLYIPADDVKEIIDLCEAKNAIYLLYSHDAIVSKMNYRAQYFINRNKHLPEEGRSVFEIIDHTDQISDFNHFNKILIIEHDEQYSSEIVEQLSRHEELEVVISQKGFIDIVRSPSSKGKAVKLIAEKYQISLDEVVVMGDQDNDVSMFEVAGKSVAMADASKLAKEAADEVTCNHEDDGVAVWLENNILFMK